MKLCSVDTCKTKHFAKSFCRRHYQQFLKTGSPVIIRPNPWGTPEERFWRYVQRSNDDACWPWTGHRDKNGYGTFRISRTINPVRAHRYAFILQHGPIAQTLLVLHTCHNPSCVNPRHLKVGDQTENMADRRAAGHHYRSDSAKEHMRQLMTGRVFTEEWRRKISHALSTLHDGEVWLIRRLLAHNVSQYTIAPMFRVHQATVSNIKRGKSYTHRGL